jgi:hypothetical protein
MLMPGFSLNLVKPALSMYLLSHQKNRTMKTKIILAGLFLTFFTVAASAQIRHNERMNHNRFHQDVKNGEITRHEARELRKDHFQLRRTQCLARCDGIVGPLERKRIHRLKLEQHRDFIRFNHNRQRRFI